jgi:hypothetical protein
VWLDDVKPLHHYSTLLRHRAAVLLTVRVRPRTYLVSVTGEAQNESLLLDPMQAVGEVKRMLAERMLTPMQLAAIELAEYCLCAASDAPLAEEQPLYQARVPATVALRFVPKPVRVEVFLPDADKPQLLDVQLQAPVAALLTRLCGEFKLVPADWRAYDLLLERETKEKSDKRRASESDSSLSSSSSKSEAVRRKRKRKQRR